MAKSFIQLEDGKLAYLAGGKGKNLMLLHSRACAPDGSAGSIFERGKSIFEALTLRFSS